MEVVFSKFQALFEGAEFILIFHMNTKRTEYIIIFIYGLVSRITSSSPDEIRNFFCFFKENLSASLALHSASGKKYLQSVK